MTVRFTHEAMVADSLLLDAAMMHKVCLVLRAPQEIQKIDAII